MTSAGLLATRQKEKNRGKKKKEKEEEEEVEKEAENDVKIIFSNVFLFSFAV